MLSLMVKDDGFFSFPCYSLCRWFVWLLAFTMSLALLVSHVDAWFYTALECTRQTNYSTDKQREKLRNAKSHARKKPLLNLACVAGVEKGSGQGKREKGRGLAGVERGRGQGKREGGRGERGRLTSLSPLSCFSPSPFCACHAGYAHFARPDRLPRGLALSLDRENNHTASQNKPSN